MTKHELVQEVERVWQQYNMSFPKFVTFVISRGILLDDDKFYNCLLLVDKENK